jgi:allantoicase
MTGTVNDPPVPEFLHLVDLASRRLGSSVVAANDESFAQRENLIKLAPPTFAAYTFGHKGQVMDGWETRRRREPGHDWAMIRLGLPGVVRGVVVDTAYFTGNYPPEISVEGTSFSGYPSPAELEKADWFPLVPRSEVGGDRKNAFLIDAPERVTHVRLCMYPDGGVARLRVYGEVVADPRYLSRDSVDLAALENGGAVVGASNTFYSSPTALISTGQARVMGEGWETARRRDDANDWVEFRLAGPGVVHVAELDTTCFVHNAPGWASLRGRDARGSLGANSAADPAATEWVELLPLQRLQPDTRHRFRLAAGPEVTHVRLDIFPDGGLARVRLRGELSTTGRAALAIRWFDLLSAAQAKCMLTAEYGLSAEEADMTIAARPLTSLDRLPAVVRADLM